MKVTSKVNKAHLDIMKEVFQRAQIKTVDALKTDVQNSHTMPFGEGTLQNESMHIDDSKVSSGKVVLVHSGIPYSRRLYFHPEFNFRQDHNSKAGGLWFEPYINGNKKEMPQKLFNKFVKKEKDNVIKD